MNVIRIHQTWLVMALAGLGSSSAFGAAVAQQPSQSDAGNGMQVLTRGPVHEAFAEAITFDPAPGFNVRTPPPDPIEELPPNQRPEGVNVDWIPGYWAWDDERNGYLWVSGVWRSLPPGREWVPGYWGQSGQEYQWISGYWADVQQEQIEYLPAPPATVEAGPNVSPPSADHVWIPGCWVWHDNGYAWSPGYWLIGQADWDWIPSHYVYASLGYVYVDGYWDYSIAQRGVLFAPVAFDPGVYARRGFSYSPTTVISLSVFSDHLFVRPRYGHYYFGDYYAPSYRESGFQASFSFQAGGRGYDPVYTAQRWQHRKDPAWSGRVEAEFNVRRDHEDARPRRTLAAQLSNRSDDSRPERGRLALASSVENYARNPDNRIRFKPVDAAERDQLVRRGEDLHRFRGERQHVETTRPGVSAEKRSDRSEPVRMKVRRSPITGKSGDQLGKDHAPPKRPEAPNAGRKAERKSKQGAEDRREPTKP